MTAWNAWSEWPLIHDPAFWAVAVPAVLMMGLSKSGFLGGFGALAVPLMSLAVPVPQAAAIMLPLLLVMDATGLQQLWKHCDRALLRRLLPAGLLGTLVGTLLFGVLSTATVSGVVGALTLLFLAQRLAFPPRADHAPPFNAYVLPLRLNPVTYAATAAVFFAAVNLSKWIPYAWLGLIDGRNMATSLALMPLAPIGVWLGIRATKRIAPTWFYRLAYAGMALTGAKLLYDGLR